MGRAGRRGPTRGLSNEELRAARQESRGQVTTHESVDRQINQVVSDAAQAQTRGRSREDGSFVVSEWRASRQRE